MISNSDVVDDPAADAAAMQASAALLQMIPDDQEIVAAAPAAIPADPPEASAASVPEPPAPAPIEPPAQPPEPVAAAGELDNIQELAARRLAAMNERRAARRGALPPREALVEHPEQVQVNPADALSFDIIEEARRRGVDPRELALAAVNRVKNPDGTAPWKPSGIAAEVETLKLQLQEQQAAHQKMLDDLHLAGEQWAQTEQQQKVAAWENQLAEGVRNAISNEDMRKQFPHVALKNPDWVGGVAVAAFRDAQERNRNLTAQQFFAGLESELRADAESYRPLYQGSAAASVAPAPAGDVPGAAPAASKAGPQSSPAAPQTQTAQGSSFKVPPELSNFRFGPDDDPAEIAAAVAFLQVNPD